MSGCLWIFYHLIERGRIATFDRITSKVKNGLQTELETNYFKNWLRVANSSLFASLRDISGYVKLNSLKLNQLFPILSRRPPLCFRKIHSLDPLVYIGHSLCYMHIVNTLVKKVVNLGLYFRQNEMLESQKETRSCNHCFYSSQDSAPQYETFLAFFRSNFWNRLRD